MSRVCCDSYNCCGRWYVSVDAKVLITLKFLAYGVSPNCWAETFQMSEERAMQSVEYLVDFLVENDFYTGKYLREMTKEDIIRLTGLYLEKHHL